jgi:hypothetical protein
MESSSIFGIQIITNWQSQQGNTHSKYPDPSNVEHNIVSIIPHGVEVEASFSPSQDIISSINVIPTCKMLC